MGRDISQGSPAIAPPGIGLASCTVTPFTDWMPEVNGAPVAVRMLIVLPAGMTPGASSKVSVAALSAAFAAILPPRFAPSLLGSETLITSPIDTSSPSSPTENVQI